MELILVKNILANNSNILSTSSSLQNVKNLIQIFNYANIFFAIIG